MRPQGPQRLGRMGKAFEPVAVGLSQELRECAAVHALRRAKRTDSSPEMYGDGLRPDRDYTGVICELAFYQWRYADWRVRRTILEREVIGYGLNDGGEDDVGINVRGSLLPPGRELDRQHLLVSVDPKNGGKCYPHWRYVAAFYEHGMHRVWLAGYCSGQELMGWCPVPYRIANYGFLSHILPVTKLKPMWRLPHVGLAEVA